MHVEDDMPDDMHEDMHDLHELHGGKGAPQTPAPTKAKKSSKTKLLANTARAMRIAIPKVQPRNIFCNQIKHSSSIGGGGVGLRGLVLLFLSTAKSLGSLPPQCDALSHPAALCHRPATWARRSRRSRR